MYCVTDIGEVVTYPMIKFDLSGHAGQVLTGAAVFKAFLLSGFSLAASRTVQIGAIQPSWDPATVTYDSFDIQSGNVDWLNSDSIVWYDSSGNGDPRYVSWTLPQAVVQGWIDDPASNHGVMPWNSAPRTWEYDLVFASLENATWDYPAWLEFHAVPEPGSCILLAIGMILGVAVCWAGRRRLVDAGRQCFTGV